MISAADKLLTVERLKPTRHHRYEHWDQDLVLTGKRNKGSDGECDREIVKRKEEGSLREKRRLDTNYIELEFVEFSTSRT